MIDYYPTLVEAVIEFKQESRKLIAGKRNNDYHVEPDHQTIELLQRDYHLEKDPQTNYIWCLKIGQSI